MSVIIGSIVGAIRRKAVKIICRMIGIEPPEAE